MKTPRTESGAAPIVVHPPIGIVASVAASALPSKAEAWAIAKAIRPQFTHYVAQYDTTKYWPKIYESIVRKFRHPALVDSGTLRDALLWKYGHLGKPRIPLAHERLISQLQQGWPAAAAALPQTPGEAFSAIDRDFGGKTRFVTVAFLVHLLHPLKAPIIDQHNFRALNALLAGARPGWTEKKMPSQYGDIVLLAAFMAAVLSAWNLQVPESVPSARDLDKFLMMYGKAIKSRSNSHP